MSRYVQALLAFVAFVMFTAPLSIRTASAETIAVNSFTLINTDTQKVIGQISDGATINLATLPTRRLNLSANTGSAKVGSVRFAWDGNATYRTDNAAPFALAGDTSGQYVAWTPGLGNHQLTATPYIRKSASGEMGPSLAITFTVVDQAPTAAPSPPARLYGVLQGRPEYATKDWDAGMRLRTLEIGWDYYEPQQGVWNTTYIAERQQLYQQMVAAGFRVVLDLGMQYPPAWAKRIRPWQDQYGNTYDGQVNAVWSSIVRERMAIYIQRVFQDLGTSFYGVRLGSGGHIETLYPGTPSGYNFSYWAFDADAMASNPVPAWRPGSPSPNGEALRFYNWYLQRLSDTVNWQQDVVRRSFGGYLIQMMPGQGLRPTQWDQLIAANLIPTGLNIYSAERGAVWDRIIDGMRDRTSVMINCSSVGDSSATSPGVNEASTDPSKWSAAHWVAYNADRYGLPKMAENPGGDSYASMEVTFRQVVQYNYTALMWAHDPELHSGQYATLTQYASLITAYR